MEILDIMKSRHAVRQYLDMEIEEDKKSAINKLVEEENSLSGLHIQALFDEPKAFDTFSAHYGKFNNVKNYLALVGKKNDEEKAGYYGEKIVISLQEMGLNSCWVALTYGKGKTPIKKEKGEKLLCVIAFGYGAAQGISHHSKPVADVLSLDGDKPDYLDRGVEAALLAPTAVNQQKFVINSKDGKVTISNKGFGFYQNIDLGIVKCHFEMATGVKVND